MKKIRVSIDLNTPRKKVRGRINKKILDATTEIDIARHKKIDDDLAMRDAGKYVARVRKKMGLSQQEFSRKIGVPLETIRNWEQGKRAPTGAAKALLRILDRSPELALLALSA
jgi:putative transcriptional regulator